ncbi:MAG: O-antigen ligase family protein [Pseudolabrys sp.]
MISARDMAMAPAPIALPAPAPVYACAPPAQAAATPLAERILLVVLYITVLASSVAIIEPSPHDALMGLLAVACLIARVRFDRMLVVPLMLLLAWNIGGLFSLIPVLDRERTLQYAITSVYLAVAALVFACILAQRTMPRVQVLRSAYVLTAIISAIVGAIGYFNLFPGAGAMFAPIGRALGFFKDPNVYGPFLIWPALITMEGLLNRRITFGGLAVLGIILFGLLLSFSRGAWFHFVVSAFVVVALSFITAPTHKVRMRIVALSMLSLAILAVALVVLLSIESIGSMFTQRAQLIQHYDVGSGGRFQLQELALGAVLNFPNGMGPFEFGRVFGLQQHNVYLQAFLVYGWFGAMAYFILLIATIYAGLRAAFVRTPWQPYVVTALGAFVGEVAEGFIIDTDHWRHFFLLLGMVWGLSAATAKARAQPSALMRA